MNFDDIINAVAGQWIAEAGIAAFGVAVSFSPAVRAFFKRAIQSPVWRTWLSRSALFVLILLASDSLSYRFNANFAERRDKSRDENIGNLLTESGPEKGTPDSVLSSAAERHEVLKPIGTGWKKVEDSEFIKSLNESRLKGDWYYVDSNTIQWREDTPDYSIVGVGFGCWNYTIAGQWQLSPDGL